MLLKSVIAMVKQLDEGRLRRVYNFIIGLINCP